MTPREAGELVVRMQARWPGFCRDAVAADEWTNDLATLRHEWALVAYRRCVDSLDRPPSWAAFFEQYRAEAAAHPVFHVAIEGPRVAPADPELVHALVGELHGMLRPKAPKEVHESVTEAQVRGTFDPLEPPLEHGQVYDESGQPRPEHTEAVERWRRRR